jgi:cell division protein FtsB
MNRLSRYREACAKHGITADAAAYRAGRDEGLYDYCQPSRGYRVGLSGQSYNGVCHAELERDFVSAHRIGYQLYTLRSEVSRVKYLLHKNEDALEDTEHKIGIREGLLISDDTTKEERVELLAELKELSEDKGEIELRIKQLIDERARRQYDVTLYEQEVAEYGY